MREGGGGGGVKGLGGGPLVDDFFAASLKNPSDPLILVITSAASQIYLLFSPNRILYLQ